MSVCVCVCVCEDEPAGRGLWCKRRVPAAERRRERRGGSPFVLMYGPKQLWKRLRGLGVRLFCVSRLT